MAKPACRRAIACCYLSFTAARRAAPPPLENTAQLLPRHTHTFPRARSQPAATSALSFARKPCCPLLIQEERAKHWNERCVRVCVCKEPNRAEPNRAKQSGGLPRIFQDLSYRSRCCSSTIPFDACSRTTLSLMPS